MSYRLLDHILGDIPFYCDITVDDEYSLVRCLAVKCIDYSHKMFSTTSTVVQV